MDPLVDGRGEGVTGVRDAEVNIFAQRSDDSVGVALRGGVRVSVRNLQGSHYPLACRTEVTLLSQKWRENNLNLAGTIEKSANEARLVFQRHKLLKF